jgi:class 3 adenylate cyclase
MKPMAEEQETQMEIGHVLFIDIVGYSQTPDRRTESAPRSADEGRARDGAVARSTDEQLVRLPTGDGMALVFHHSAEEPARCALEIAEALRKHPEIPVRMGIHSGPVQFGVVDVNERNERGRRGHQPGPTK